MYHTNIALNDENDWY